MILLYCLVTFIDQYYYERQAGFKAYQQVMVCHLIKPAAGCRDIDQLVHRQTVQLARDSHHNYICITTRRTPRRSGELLADGGSLYWVINHRIACRQTIHDIATLQGDNGSYCAIWLDPCIIRTLAVRKKPFQGWRYLNLESAPRDIGAYHAGDADDAPPPEMAEDLRELGLL